ncbi:MAG: sn-glycerol-3-phosphate ABC transporter ATP-binding protein UgpC [Candidatus Eisenbacteria bacterium]|uniref:Sn-glycerol-3-phosphate ABC transporter ATP-binding protein UgpC n=1 Tax=Eiseniibacteriota bacterium TaxID=2212470 RepID=A0A933SIL3_UNCEI|nr:sn-glycerol-3-phosphate ABC transporter ATP-binding protein UgpC [Candidatus Eisenbacteria bacterium]
MPSVELSKLGKSYGRGQKAVDGVSLSIRDGEFLVLVGPSGCGKSTVLRMVAGLEEISEGTIQIGDRVVNEVAPKDRDVAMVFQNYALYPHMSVFDNMAFGLRRRKASEAEVQQKVNETAEVLGLTTYLQRRPRELSGGERQRVALGRAMVRKPQVFLFDEPLSNLDAKLRVQMRAEIKRLHQRVGATMIYVTHDQVEAMTLGDRIAVMRKGILQQCADPFTLYTAPANQFVAGFIGSPPINFFTANVSADGGSIESGGVTIALGEAQRAAVAPLKGKPVNVGIRPEDLHLEGVIGAAIPATCEVREPLGNETLVHWKSPVGEIVSRVPGQSSPAVGAQATLQAPLEKLHLFDPTSELSLTAAPVTV